MPKRVLCAAAIGLLATASLPATGAETDIGNVTCASVAAKSQLLRQVIADMKADQMLNDMSDLDHANLALSKVEGDRKPDGSVTCKALLTLRVLYGAGLMRTIDNNVTYDLSMHGEDRHVAVTIHKLATAF